MKQNNRRNDKNRKSLWDRFVSIFFEEVPYDEIDFESLDRAFAEAEKKEKDNKNVKKDDKEKASVGVYGNYPEFMHYEKKKEEKVEPKKAISEIDEIDARDDIGLDLDRFDVVAPAADEDVVTNKPAQKKKAVKNKPEKKEIRKEVKETEEETKKERKIGAREYLAILLAAVIGAFTTYSILNRKPEIDETNSTIMNSIEDDTQIDEVFDEYNKDLEKFYTASTTETLDTMLSGDRNVVSSVDKLEELINLSNKLDDYDLDDVLKLNGNLRSLTVEEKSEIKDMSRADLLAMMDQFDEVRDLDFQEFHQDSIDYTYLVMKLSYAKYVIDSQIMKYGTDLLSTYPELIIKAVIIDETGLETLKFSDIDIKYYDGSYNACYRAPESSTEYRVVLDSKSSQLIEDKQYFDTFGLSDDSFIDFKKMAIDTLNDCKIMLLADHDLNYSGPESSTKYTLRSSSNFSVREKAKKLK